MRRLPLKEDLDFINRGIRRLRVNKSNVSDGSHTFGELYDHRTAILLYAMKNSNDRVWIARYHNDGTYHDGYFIAGINVNEGEQITYHCTNKWWNKFAECENIEVYEVSPFKWDGHTSEDVLFRLAGGDI